MKRIAGLLTVFVAVAVFAMAGQAGACVGKSLVIGSVDMPSVSMVSEMMAILITERTGTTVVVKKFPDYASCYESAAAGEVDIIVDFTGRGYVEVLKKGPETDADKVLASVKEIYERDMNMVWLGQLGFSQPGMEVTGGVETPAMAATIIRKETLSKFPALPRVLAKLSGKLDDESVAKLVSDIGDDDSGKKAAKVTRKFLKSKRMI